jgi:predicted Zn-dependent protease
VPVESIGALLLGAGRLQEAEAWLSSETKQCTYSPLIRAKLLLGRTYEEMGDDARACAAYGDVARTWASPKPRSVTLDAARARAKKLGCR